MGPEIGREQNDWKLTFTEEECIYLMLRDTEVTHTFTGSLQYV